MCSYFELKWTRWSSRGNGRPPSWCSDPLSILVAHYQKHPRCLKFTSRMSCPSGNVPGQRWSLRADPHHQPIIDNPLQSNSIQSNWIRFNPTQSNLAQLMGEVKWLSWGKLFYAVFSSSLNLLHLLKSSGSASLSLPLSPFHSSFQMGIGNNWWTALNILQGL